MHSFIYYNLIISLVNVWSLTTWDMSHMTFIIPISIDMCMCCPSNDECTIRTFMSLQQWICYNLWCFSITSSSIVMKVHPQRRCILKEGEISKHIIPFSWGRITFIHQAFTKSLPRLGETLWMKQVHPNTRGETWYKGLFGKIIVRNFIFERGRRHPIIGKHTVRCGCFLYLHIRTLAQESFLGTNK